MKILLCHERFCLRYGVDRVLLSLAREFRRRGHHVTLLGSLFDEIGPAEADRTIPVPRCAVTYDLEVHTLRWLGEHWPRLFGAAHSPDIVLNAGWHFVSSMDLFALRGARVVYSDHGVIPTKGLPEVGQRTIGILRELKAMFGRSAAGVVSVSRFIQKSENWAFPAMDHVSTVIRNGADHISASEWPSAPRTPSSVRPRILALGRFEPGFYKQSEQIFALENHIRVWAPDAWIGIFSTEAELSRAAAGSTRIVPLGRPSDESMTQLIRECDFTVCLSRWEGFNLPLAESQLLGRPCLVFAIGAHPEVVAEPWLLCADIDEMAAKIRALAEARAPAAIRDGSALVEFAKTMKWSDVADHYLAFFQRVPPRERTQLQAWSPRSERIFIMDVTNGCRDPANSGCVRVTRRLAAELQQYDAVVFVAWDRTASRYHFPTRDEFLQLGAFQGPIHRDGHPLSEKEAPRALEPWLEELAADRAWLLLPEIRHREDLEPILEFAARRRLKTASIFHDAIPLERPDLVSDPIYREGHFAYMVGLARCDVSVANSHSSENALRAFWSKQGLSGRSRTCLLPGGLSGVRPVAVSDLERGEHGRKFILCVSTLEPRKNHRRLLEAFRRVRQSHPALGWDLVLVGTRSYWSPDIVAAVETAGREDPSVRWLGVVPDGQLADLYRRCEFTVYASELEGFGLPIMESIWYGRPCLCHAAGVMAELAAGGGCATADLTNTDAFVAALTQLIFDEPLRARLAAECAQRPVKQWPDFAAEFLALLATVYWSEIAGPGELALVP